MTTVDTELVDDIEATTSVVELIAVSTTEIVSGSSGGGAGGLIPGDDRLAVFGKAGTFGTAPAHPTTSYGERQRLVPVQGFQFSPGMGPFFSQVLPDGTIAMPEMLLTISQVGATGKTMACSFFHPYQGFYTVRVPTNQGHFECLQVNSVTGVVSDAGGADLSDCTIVYEDDGTPVLFCLSAWSYKGWRVSTFGVWPVLPAFVLDDGTGRWVYDEARSIFASTLRASHADGPELWPNVVNFYGETVTEGRLPAELVTLPVSGHVAISQYAPRSGHNWGGVMVVDTAAKAHKAWYEWPDMVDPYGWASKSFTRDINADPTSAANDERIVCNHDVFMQPNETWNVTIHASSGTWRVSWNGAFTAGMPVGTRAEDLRAALEAIPAIGAGNVSVRESRPFLVDSFITYEVEMIGPFAHTDLTATPVTVDASSLVGSSGFTAINRWQHGGTAYSKQSNFPFSELSYNEGAGTLTLKTVPMFLQSGTEQPVRGYVPDASAGMTWFTADGDLVVTASGHSSNPQISTVFRSHGMHVWRKPAGGERGYIAQATPTTDWEDRYGEARPTPDFITTPLHADGNGFVLGLAEDYASGGIIAPCASGLQLMLQPHGRWVNRSGMLVRPSSFAGAGDLTGWTATNGHTLAYDAGETAMRWTAINGTDSTISSVTGTNAVPIPEAWEGEIVHFAVESKAATVKRLIRPAVRFYNAAGAEVGALTGYGAAVSYNTVGSYRRIVGAAKIPALCRFMSVQFDVLDPGGAAEVHYFRLVEVKLAAFWPTPGKAALATSYLFADKPGGSWLAKGFVDPETRHLWLPYLQIMGTDDAKNTVHPAWLGRVNCADYFVDHPTDGLSMTAAEFTAQNPVLAAGEQGTETDTRKSKIGSDGLTAWVDLGYETT